MGATTLLILDIQNGILDIFSQEITKPYIEKLAKVLSAARDQSINIIHVITAFRPGYPECHPLNASFSAITSTGKYLVDSSDVKIPEAVKPLANEPVIIKNRVSAFTGTSLDLLLRSSNTDHLVVAGIATSGAVLSTIRQAQDLDFHITLLQDLCLDRDDEVHRVLVEKVIGRKADLFDSLEWVDRVKDGKST